MLGILLAVADPGVRGLQAAPPCEDSLPIPARGSVADRDAVGRVRLDTSRPVPPKSAVLAAWRKRQEAIRSFQFTWTEEQCHPTGWVANPRHPERERLALPTLYQDRSFTVQKTLAVDGDALRYGFELDRKPEPDGIIVTSPSGEERGLGEGKRYSYLSVFDGHRGERRLTLLNGSMPPTRLPLQANEDAQNLDNRAIMLALRPLDPILGDRLVDRAVTNLKRTFYRGNSIFLLEEQRDPSGWKSILWIEPERDFRVVRLAVMFEQRWIVDMDIDYRQDARWGWIPSGWRATEMLADGTRRHVTTATVSSYHINEAIDPAQFR
jgi:hypothetical protein